ncbi:MAG: sigma factor [Candidatus Weimeria sp.]
MDTIIKAKKDYIEGRITKADYFSLIWESLKKEVTCLAYRWGKYGTEEDDLLQDAALAVMEHLDDYEPSRTVPSSFFAPYMTEAMREDCTRGKSRFYLRKAAELDTKAKDAGFTGLSDESLSDEVLSVLSGVSLRTVTSTRRYAGVSKMRDNSEGDFTASAAYHKSPEDILMERCTEEEMGIIAEDVLTPQEHILLICFSVLEMSEKEVEEKLKGVYKEYGFKKAPARGYIRQAVFKSRKKLKRAVIERGSMEDLANFLE